jgi:hypothetical protein
VTSRAAPQANGAPALGSDGDLRCARLTASERASVIRRPQNPLAHDAPTAARQHFVFGELPFPALKYV